MILAAAGLALLAIWALSGKSFAGAIPFLSHVPAAYIARLALWGGAIGLIASGRQWAGAALVIGLLLYGFLAPSTKAPRTATLAGGPGVRAAYALLGIAPGAPPADIRAAHRRLIASAHPDRGGTAEQAARLNQARDLLLRIANER